MADHGGAGSKYSHEGCRCNLCVEANTARIKRRREQRLQERIPKNVKHGASTYWNWGCLCAICTQANKDRCKAYRERRQG